MVSKTVSLKFNITNTGQTTQRFYWWSYLVNTDENIKKMSEISNTGDLTPGQTWTRGYSATVDLTPGLWYIGVAAVYPDEASARANVNKLHDWNSGVANNWDPTKGAYISVAAVAQAQITAIQVT